MRWILHKLFGWQYAYVDITCNSVVGRVRTNSKGEKYVWSMVYGIIPLDRARSVFYLF
jgi:hypothetical protein